MEVWESLLSFPGSLPCKHRIHMILNLCFSPINLSFITGVLNQQPRRTEDKLFFLLHSESHDLLGETNGRKESLYRKVRIRSLVLPIYSGLVGEIFLRNRIQGKQFKVDQLIAR